MWQRFVDFSIFIHDFSHFDYLGTLEDLLKPTLNTTLKNEVVTKVCLLLFPPRLLLTSSDLFAVGSRMGTLFGFNCKWDSLFLGIWIQR
jgi:hypothetical protein